MAKKPGNESFESAVNDAQVARDQKLRRLIQAEFPPLGVGPFLAR